MPKIQIRRDTAANWKTNNPTLLQGELALETDERKMKIGDGTTDYNNLSYTNIADEWQKPADWVDLRSGALPKSIYLLVGHKADYSAYRYLDFHIVLSDTTHNFKVYIDYNLYGTYASGTDVKIDWQTLALTTGKTTTTPIELVTHIIRIVPENDADTITEYDNNRYGSSGNEQEGVLWAHFTQNEMALVKFTVYGKVYQPLLTAITALDDKLYITGVDMAGFIAETQDSYARRSAYLAKLPVIEVDTLTAFGSMFNHAGPLKKAKIIVNNSISVSGTSAGNGTSFASGNIEEIEINKPIKLGSSTSTAFSLFRVSNIKKLPVIDFTDAVRLRYFITTNPNLQDTVLDVSAATNLKELTIPGALNSPGTFMGGLKGVIVSNQAPFDYGTAPQIDISDTGLDRAALVALFNSMPTVSASQVCNIKGCTGAADLTAADLAIATGKGWTVTR